jgi:glycosyltransferase involved in cell wall biosynthesis
MKHILIIVQNLPVPFDRRVWMEATTLRSAGYGVSVICPKKKMYTASFETLEGVDIYRYPLMYEADQGVFGYLIEFATCWILTSLLAVWVYLRHPFHAIHACNPPDTYFLLALLFRPFGVKFVFDHHDLSPEMYLAKGARKDSILYRGLLALERLTMKSADMVIAVNESHKSVAIRRGGIPESRLVVVRSGPRAEWAAKNNPDQSLRSGRKYLAVYLGEMCTQDGLDMLLHAIAEYVRRFGDDTQFSLIGGGPDQQRLVRLAKDMGLELNTKFTGRISDQELWAYLSTADVCLDPDPPTEWSNMSTMNKMIEYMAFGRPIVAFDLLEHRRTAQDAASYVAEANPLSLALEIRRVIKSETLRLQMSKVASSRFTSVLAWENSGSVLVQAYDRLLLM